MATVDDIPFDENGSEEEGEAMTAAEVLGKLEEVCLSYITSSLQVLD